MTSNEKLVVELKEFCKNYQFESNRRILLRNAVKVGESKIDKSDVLCTYIDRNTNEYWNYDHFSMNVIHSPKECDLYGTNYDFAFVYFIKENKYTAAFLNRNSQKNDYTLKHDTIKIYPDALQLILNEVKNSGNKWLDHQKKIQNRHLHYVRFYINAKTSEDRKKISWEDRLEDTKIRAELEHLMWRRPKNSDQRRFDEMTKMGQIEYDAQEEKQCEIVAKLLKDLKEGNL